jgi:hypothetical protein
MNFVQLATCDLRHTQSAVSLVKGCGAFRIRYPAVDAGWDFEDRAQLRSHLPRLSEPFLD